MLAATNEATDRINAATQAVRAAQGQLGPAATIPRGDGREISFCVGDQVLIRRNDRANEAVTGEVVLNGYRGVVTSVSAHGVGVAWRQPGDDPAQAPHTATCSAAYIADGGLDLGYCLTTHKAEGLTIAGRWTRADGTSHHGSVLVWTPGMDQSGLYVAATRDRGSTILFGALEELEADQQRLRYGAPADQQTLTERVIAALADRAAATAHNANDRPVLVDLDQVADPPAEPHHQTVQTPAQLAQPAQVGEATTRQGLLTQADRQRWRALRERIARAWLDERHDERAAAQAERAAFIAQIGPDAAAALEREDAQRWAAYLADRAHQVEPLEPTVLSEADQERLTQLEAAVLAAWREHGEHSPALAEARAARDEFTAHLDLLRGGHSERLRAQRTQREAARAAAHGRWMDPSPQVRWSDRQLQEEIDAAEADRRRELAAARTSADRLAELEAAVAAAAGPAVLELNERLAAWRRIAELRTRYEQAQQLARDADAAERRAGYQARQASQQAAALSWPRTGRKHRLETQAAQWAEQAAQARTMAAAWRTEAERIGADLGPHRHTPNLADTLRRLEASYEADRAQATQQDQNQLRWLRQDIDFRHRQAARHAARHDELLAEKTTRAAMPTAQASLEAMWRTSWAIEQRRRDAEAAEREDAKISHRYTLDREMGLTHGYGQDRGQSHDRDQSHGQGLGMGL